MYHNNPWGPSPSSDTSIPANDPFLESSASNRFPALDTSEPSFRPSSPYSSQSYSSPLSQFPQSSYNTQQIQPQYTQWNGQVQPQSPTFHQGFQNYAAAPQQQYQLSGYASYSQQSGQQAYGGQLQSQPQLQAQYTGYMQSQQPSVTPQQYQQSIVSQFDPYSGSNGSGGSNNGWSGQTQSQSSTPSSPTRPQRLGPSGQQHPRQFIQTHKAGLESWNAATWKQAINTFEELKRSWERQRKELQNHLVTGQYLTVEDIASVNGVRVLAIDDQLTYHGLYR
jgi:hypothetical protein